MNWGYKILIVYVVFVLGILYLVYRCNTQTVDLVTEKYYDREIAYQDQYDRMKNSDFEGNRVHLVYEPGKSFVSIQYPIIVQNANPDGEIYFFKPDNAKLDFALPVNPDQSGNQVIPVDKIERGLWRVQIKWNVSGVPLYQEEKIVLK
jgi:hypothetical protein